MKWLMEPVAVALGIIIVIVAVMLFGGFYLKTTQTPIAPTPTPAPMTTVIPTEIPTTEETPPPTPEVTLPPPPTTPQGSYVVGATPIRDESIYNAPDFRSAYKRMGADFPVIYEHDYDGKFQYEALNAVIVHPPFIIDFAVTPGSSSPVRSFFIITVWDNSTHKVLAQDGYFRTYSANSPKRLQFSFPGDFYVEMHGGFVTVDLTIRAGP